MQEMIKKDLPMQEWAQLIYNLKLCKDLRNCYLVYQAVVFNPEQLPDCTRHHPGQLHAIPELNKVDPKIQVSQKPKVTRCCQSWAEACCSSFQPPQLPDPRHGVSANASSEIFSCWFWHVFISSHIHYADGSTAAEKPSTIGWSVPVNSSFAGLSTHLRLNIPHMASVWLPCWKKKSPLPSPVKCWGSPAHLQYFWFKYLIHSAPGRGFCRWQNPGGIYYKSDDSGSC